MTTDLSALRKRVEEATGPDRGIDAAICARLRFLPNFEAWKVKRAEGEHGKIFAEGRCVVLQGKTDTGSFSVRDYPPPITASLDAALGLVDAKLPGWKPGVWQTPNGWEAELAYPEPMRASRGTMFANMSDRRNYPTPALALLSALLSALETQ